MPRQPWQAGVFGVAFRPFGEQVTGLCPQDKRVGASDDVTLLLQNLEPKN